MSSPEREGPKYSAGRFKTWLAVAVGCGGLYLFAGGSVIPGGAGVAQASVSHQRIVTVRPGQTLWSIAEEVEPSQDPRPLVDQLVGELHGSAIQVGEQVVIP